MYKLLEAKFPILPTTRLSVIDFSRLPDASDPSVRRVAVEAHERAARGEVHIEHVNFEKVEMADERYPMENRGWTFWVGYSRAKDTLLVKAAGLP